jgi:hypothetical protein
MTITSLQTSERFVLSLAVLVFSFLLFGCGSGEVRGRIFGRVTFEGKPVAEGRVVFANASKGIHMTAKIKADGHYEVNTARGAGLPLATYQVCISPPPIEGITGVFGQKQKAKEYPDIPLKYRDPKTSSLTLTLQRGENPFDIPGLGYHLLLPFYEHPMLLPQL